MAVRRTTSKKRTTTSDTTPSTTGSQNADPVDEKVKPASGAKQVTVHVRNQRVVLGLGSETTELDRYEARKLAGQLETSSYAV